MADSLLVNTIKGLKWSTISQVSRQVLQYISTIILVGIISPDDFGLLAMAVIIIGFLDIFKDLGTGSAIIQSENPSEELKSSIFWINVLFGLAITLIVYFSSSIAASIYNSEKIQPVLEALSISFFISGFSILQKSLLEKKLSFQVLSKIELFSSAVSFFVVIFLAIEGFGVWCLVFQSLSNTLISSLLLWLFSDWKPKLIFKLSEIKAISHYSVNLVGFNIINYLARNSDYFLIGKFLGDNALGHYYLAYRIMLYPIQNITVVISRVMFPSFSKIQNDNDKFRIVFSRITSAISLITFPMMAGLAVVSNDITLAFFSSNWNVSLMVQLIIILSPVGAMQSVISTVGNIYQAKGKTDWMLKWSLFASVLTVLGFLIGLNWGVVGVALSYLVTNLIMLYPVFAIPFKLIEMPVIVFFKSFVSTILSIVGMIAVVYVLSNLIGIYFEPIIRLIILIFAGIISYISVSFIINKKNIHEMKSIFTQYTNYSKKGL